MVIYGRDRRLSLSAEAQAQVARPHVQRRSLTSTIRALAVGDFSGNHVDDLAVLAADGKLQLINRSTQNNLGGVAAIAQWQSKVMANGLNAGATQLVRARLSSDPVDSLVMTDAAAHQLRVITASHATSRVASAGEAQATESQLATFDVDGETAAVLPMRLNGDALNDLVVLKAAAQTLAIAVTQAQSTLTVTNTNDQGLGSFRQAILDANANPGLDTITFQIPGGGIPTIAPLSPLPDITDPVTIDGTTQPAGKVELNGAQVVFPDPLPDGRLAIALRIKDGNSTIRGLVINRFDWRQIDGVSVNGAGGCIYLADQGHNIIEGNLIGTDVNATTWLSGPSSITTFPNSPDNQIGGTTANARNVILGPVDLNYDGGNVIQGNYIGTNLDGTASVTGLDPIFNRILGSGIEINSPNNLLGGTTAGARNVIASLVTLIEGLAGPGGPARPHTVTGNLIQGNYIGTDATGSIVLGGGIEINNSPDTTVGGTTPAARNVVSGSQFIGIYVRSSDDTAGGTLIQGNYIGTDQSGLLPLGNNLAGAPAFEADPFRPARGGVCVYIGSPPGAVMPTNEDIMVGGSVAEARNVIAASLTYGMVITGAISRAEGRIGVTVQNNYIGTDAGGVNPLGNQADGIFVGSLSLQCKIANNLIAFNGGSGVNIPTPPGTLPGKRITISSNAIHSNSLLGIDLGDAGVTDNDPLDADTGANELQNFPVLTSATATAANVTVSGTLSTTAGATATLQFFYGTDHQGHQLIGSAPVSLGQQQVTTDGSGNASFTLSFAAPAGIADGWVTATATDAAGDTSEFADCIHLEKSNCAFLLSLTSQSFKSSGGTGSVNITAAGDCNWMAVSNEDWITVTSNGSGIGSGAVGYTVAANPNTDPRTGTLTIAGQTLTVVQAGTGPLITGISISGKNLVVAGENFDSGSVIFVDGQQQKTIRDGPSLKILKGKKVAKKIAPGQTVSVQVRTGKGALSQTVTFTRPG